MNPGRELDALVAKQVMGIPVTKDEYGYWPPPLPGKNFSSHEIPEYSSSIQNAWEVVEKVSRHKIDKYPYHCFTIQYSYFPEINEDEYWQVGWADTNDDNFYWVCDARSASLPHAICLAALKAVGVEI